VKVRSGYGRNYLMPRGIALPATKDNQKVFEERRSELMAHSAERLDRASARAEQIRGREFVIAMRSSDEGKLFGSVGPHEIATKVTEEAAEVDTKEVAMPDGQIRQVGEHTVLLQLHPEVEFEITVIVAQLTDMGINMPPRRGAADEEVEEEVAADEETEAQAEEVVEAHSDEVDMDEADTDEDA